MRADANCPHDFYRRAEYRCVDCLSRELQEEYERGVKAAAKWVGDELGLAFPEEAAQRLIHALIPPPVF